jgi:hypothetical protein
MARYRTHDSLREDTETEISEAKAKKMEPNDGGEDEDDSYESVEDAADATKESPKRKGDKKNGDKAAEKADSAFVKEMKDKMKAKDDDDDEDEDDDKDDDDDDDDDNVEESYDFGTEFADLISEEATLSEAFKEKAGVIVETAIKAKVKETARRLEEEYEAKFEQSIEKLGEELVEMLDSYLDSVVEEWLSQNALAVDKGIRTEIAEEFMEGLHELFEDSYITVPESQVDIVDELAEENAKIEKQFNAIREENMRLQKEAVEFHKDRVIRDVSEGLVDTQADKLRNLVEDLDFSDVETFRKKVEMVKESYFTKKSANYQLDEDVDGHDEPEKKGNVRSNVTLR